MAFVRKIRKYHGGGLKNIGDPGIPKARVEVYLRSARGETFYVPTLYEGILHLLSKDGYRLGVYEWPDGAGFNRELFAIVVRRYGNELSVLLEAPMLINFPMEENRVKFNLSHRSLIPEERNRVKVVSLNEILGLSEPEVSIKDQIEEVEVIIEGT